VFGLIFLAISVPNENPPEEGPDVKYGQFAEVSGTNDDLEDLNNFKNLGFYNGIYYWAGIVGTELKVYSCTALTGATSTLHTYDLSGFTDIGTYASHTVLITKTVYTNSDWFCIVGCSFVDNTGDKAIYVGLYNITDDTAWQDIEAVAADAYVSMYLMDFYVLNQSNDEIQMMAYYTTALAGLMDTYTIDESLGTCVVDDSAVPMGFRDDVYSYYAGGMYDGEYYFIHVRDNPLIRLYKATTTNVLTWIEDLTTTAPASWNYKVQLYWRQGNQEFIVDEDHFYYRTIGTSTWASVVDSGTTTNGIVWAYDLSNILKINWIIWKDSIYKIFAGGGVAKIQTYTGNAYVGWNDWFANGADKIYQLDP